MTEREFREWNEEMARKYDPDLFHHHPNPVIRYVERKRVRRILAWLVPQPGEYILDVGCGAGNVLEQMQVGHLIGVDLSSYLLGKARRRLLDKASLIQGNVETLPLRTGTFDKAYCSEVLEHLPHPEQVLREIRRILKPSGLLIISVPNEALINRIKGVLLKLGLFRLILGGNNAEDYQSPTHMEDEWHLSQIDPHRLRQMCENLFLIEAVSSIPFSFFPLRYVLISRPCHSQDE